MSIHQEETDSSAHLGAAEILSSKIDEKVVDDPESDEEVKSIQDDEKSKFEALACCEEFEGEPTRFGMLKLDYDHSRNPKLRDYPWSKIQSLLEANDGYYLTLSEKMAGGGILFGIDDEGNPLISSRWEEAGMGGQNFTTVYNRAHFKHSEFIDKVLTEKDKPVSSGYEMFPYRKSGEGDEQYANSTEIAQCERHTGKPFVQGDPSFETEAGSASWVESDSRTPVLIYLDSSGKHTFAEETPNSGRYDHPWCGVRLLLRLREKGEVKRELRQLTPEEQTEETLKTFRQRFFSEESRQLHGIYDWSRVENTLRASPESILKIQKMEENGHEPGIYFSDKEGFDIGTTNKNVYSIRNSDCIYDLRQQGRPGEEFHSGAVKYSKEIGIDIMAPDQYVNRLQKHSSFDADGRVWLKADEKMKEDGMAPMGFKDSLGKVVVKPFPIDFHCIGGSWRGTFRVPWKA